MEISDKGMQKYHPMQCSIGDVIVCKLQSSNSNSYIIGTYARLGVMNNVVYLNCVNPGYAEWYLDTCICKLATPREILWYRGEVSSEKD